MFQTQRRQKFSITALNMFTVHLKLSGAVRFYQKIQGDERSNPLPQHNLIQTNNSTIFSGSTCHIYLLIYFLQKRPVLQNFSLPALPLVSFSPLILLAIKMQTTLGVFHTIFWSNLCNLILFFSLQFLHHIQKSILKCSQSKTLISYILPHTHLIQPVNLINT